MFTNRQFGSVVAAISLVVGLAACSSTRMIVLDPAVPAAPYSAVSLERARFVSSVPQREALAFEQSVLDDLEGFATSGARVLRIEYRILCVTKEDQLGHWFRAGREGGEETVTIEVVFRDENRKELARIQMLGYIKGGLFGSSLAETLEDSADDVAEYALENFLVASE